MAVLPVDLALPDVLDALRTGTRALLIAPPGAGKTTRVPPALLTEPWCTGTVLLLVPRRLAARAAAEFIAFQRGEDTGRTIGYQTRLDSKTSRSTRVIAMTHGVYLAKLQQDPELTGVSAVLFDEVHERSLDNDLALALTLDTASGLRPDLRLMAMSATLDSGGFARLLGDPPLIRSEGASHPLEIVHEGRDASVRMEPQMAGACRRAVADYPGSLLAFLPGVAEIERTADALGPLPGDVVLHRLHGGIDPREQRAALAEPPAGKRKLVLATSIAETSVTLEDVRIVVDSGLARRPRYDPGAGLTRLTTERASRAAVTQRAGRAARQGPGVAIRLWEHASTASLPAHDPPEILEADLSSLLLTCMLWGETDPTRLSWIDPPPAPALAEARRRLTDLEAIEEGRITGHGRAITALPVEPRLAHMMLRSAENSFGNIAADVAMLLSERGLGGNDPDLDTRRRRWLGDRSPRATAARRMAERWRKQTGVAEGSGESECGRAVALAFPDRVARRRDSTGERWQSVGGRGFRLDPASSLARNDWLAVAEVAGHASSARIQSAAPIDETGVLALFVDRIETREEIAFDSATGGIIARQGRYLGAITLGSGPLATPDQSAIERTLLEGVRTHGVHLLPWADASRSFVQRSLFAHRFDSTVPSLADDVLLDRLDEWLPPLLSGKRRLSDIAEQDFVAALQGLAGYDGVRAIGQLAPSDFLSPAGSRHSIDYSAPGGPLVEVRAQALFGLSQHPMLAGGRVPLTLAITSPAGRPIQTSRDLASFWTGSWRDVAKEMRGRYPKHPWPDDPANAAPTLRTKRAGLS